MDVLGSVLGLAVDLLAVLVLFRVTPALGGSTLPEVLLMFALSATAFALADLAVGSIERLRR